MRVLIIVMVLPFLTGAATKRSDIVKFVKEHFPGKISKLDAILDRYSGKEDKLMKKLVRKKGCSWWCTLITRNSSHRLFPEGY